MPTLLYVEDDPDDRELFQVALGYFRLNLSLCIVNDAAEAIEYLQAAGRFANRIAYPLPNVILLDLMMPGMSGIEFLSWLNVSEYKSIPAVVVTDSVRPEQCIAAKELGATLVLSKSRSFKELESLLHDLAQLSFENWRHKEQDFLDGRT